MPFDVEANAEDKEPLITTAPVAESDASPSSKLPPLQLYQALVGNVDSPPSRRPHLYHSVQNLERKTHRLYWVTGLLFACLIALQMIFCLIIAIGAQLNLPRNAISITAGINTLVAAGIATLKGLGLPEKKAVERYKLKRILDEVEFTTRRLQAGLNVDVEAKVAEMRTMQEKTEDEGRVIFQGADVAAALKAAQTKDAPGGQAPEAV
nr:hypothetical protein B0A51_06077 [Rachicladosporium sp. CCFEE 5018]